MDPHSVQPSSKCSGSDFSIKRILGGTRSDEEEHTATPSWLCCTRYQPPRLPRSNNVSGNRARRSGRHARVPFTAAQAAALEAAYSRAPYLAPPALRALAAALQLRDDRIKIWFQNRRARERREKSGDITPPRAITLQPSNISRVSPQDMIPSWSRLQSPLNSNSTPIEYRHTNLNSNILVPNCATSTESHDILSFNNEIFSNVSDSISLNDNRCESPVDIETVDS